jgi:CheY-like chemotaxis protein
VNMELSAARNRSLAGGMDGYQTKPIRPQELDEVLAGYLGKRTVTANPVAVAAPRQGNREVMAPLTVVL